MMGLPALADDSLPVSPVYAWSNLGASPYDAPSAVLGRPSTWILGTPGPGFPGGNIATSMVFAAYNTDLSGNKVVTTINPGGYIVVQFDPPIEHDPGNWFDKDFIVFGNSVFAAQGSVAPNSDMEVLKTNNGLIGTWEPSVVGVSQDGTNFYDYTGGPYADDFAPTQAFSWDRDNHTWDMEMDWTKPIDPTLTKSSFANKFVADAIDLYNGSAGGTAFDISVFPLPVNANGRKWIRYIRITGSGGEVDAVTRVSHIPPQTPIAQAKKLPDGSKVRLSEGIVVAGEAELGDCVYIEAPDRACGIRVTGRSIKLGKRVIVSGVMATSNGERKLKALSVEELGTGSVAPLAVTGSAFAGPGLSINGMLVKVCGKTKFANLEEGTFTVNDGSGVEVNCIYPAGNMIELSTDGTPVTITGIASCQLNANQQVVPTLRTWTQAVSH